MFFWILLINSPLSDVHTSGHGGQEELKLMLKLIKPKYFMPIHGEYRMLKIHSNIAHMTGVKKGNEFVFDNGGLLAVTRNSARYAGKVASGTVYVDGKGIGDIGNIVLRDRRLLSEDGLLSAIVTVNDETLKVIGKPSIISRGFIYMREHEELTKEISNLVSVYIQKKITTMKKVNIVVLKKELTKLLSDYIYAKTERSPMIMPVVMTVN